MSEQPGLFPEPDPPTPLHAEQHASATDRGRLSADRKRSLRQLEAIRRGGHPLGLVFIGRISRHPDTIGLTYDRDQPRGRPLTCGTCRWRSQAGLHTWPKCWWWDDTSKPGVRVTASACTDVRAWWPACRQYDAGDPGLSEDAWRAAPHDPAGDDGARTDRGED